jgi:hypothetical protein
VPDSLRRCLRTGDVGTIKGDVEGIIGDVEDTKDVVESVIRRARLRAEIMKIVATSNQGNE